MNFLLLQGLRFNIQFLNVDDRVNKPQDSENLNWSREIKQKFEITAKKTNFGVDVNSATLPGTAFANFTEKLLQFLLKSCKTRAVRQSFIYAPGTVWSKCSTKNQYNASFWLLAILLSNITSTAYGTSLCRSQNHTNLVNFLPDKITFDVAIEWSPNPQECPDLGCPRIDPRDSSADFMNVSVSLQSGCADGSECKCNLDLSQSGSDAAAGEITVRDVIQLIASKIRN